MKKKKFIEDYSWVVRGKQRRKTILYVTDSQTPTQIAKKSGLSLNHVSRILNEFKKHKLAVCLNPKQKTGRLYTLTKRGKIIRDKILKTK